MIWTTPAGQHVSSAAGSIGKTASEWCAECGGFRHTCPMAVLKMRRISIFPSSSTCLQPDGEDKSGLSSRFGKFIYCFSGIISHSHTMYPSILRRHLALAQTSFQYPPPMIGRWGTIVGHRTSIFCSTYDTSTFLLTGIGWHPRWSMAHGHSC